MTKPPKFKLPVVVLLILMDDEKVLLMRRQNTGWGDGDYDLVAGHIDGHETLPDALCREAAEEAGITVKPEDANFVHLLHYVGDTEYLYAFFTVSVWQNTPTIMEPHKCDDISWFPLSDLPDNIAPITKDVLQKYREGALYSEVVVK